MSDRWPYLENLDMDVVLKFSTPEVDVTDAVPSLSEISERIRMLAVVKMKESISKPSTIDVRNIDSLARIVLDRILEASNE